MELKDRKWLNNNKESLKLPGFANGWENFNQFINSNTQANTGLGTRGGVSSAQDLSTPQGRIDAVKNDKTIWDSATRDGAGKTAADNYFKLNGPTQADSSAAGAGPWFAIGSWLGGGVLEGLNSKKSADQLLVDAGTGSSSIGGISYQTQNEVSSGKVMSDYDRSTATDFLTNPARGITKLFSRDSQEEQVRQAQATAYRINQYNRDSALSEHLAQLQGLKYGDTKSQTLSAANGKQVNAKVSNGELVGNFDENYVYKVPGKPNNKDTKYTYLKPSDFVISNKYGLSKLAQKTGDYAGVLNLQNILMNGYKCGKLPRYNEGWLGNFIPNAISGLASLDQIINAGRQKPYKPNTYVGNRYANNALSTLAGLRVNPYNIYPSIYNVYDRTVSGIDRSGGLSSGQRAASKIAAMSQTQANMANMLTNNQIQNNAYKSNWAEKALATGAQDAQARMAAKQFDENYFAKSHAARQQGLQMGLYNLINSVQNYYANDFKRRQFNETMNLYRSQNQLDWERLNYQLNHV